MAQWFSFSPRTLLLHLSRRRQALQIIMLALLHVALLQDIDSDFGRILMLPHFALFLLWQPFVNTESRIPNRQILITVAVLLMAAFWMSWWLAGFWLVLLAGIVGGRVFFYSDKTTRIFYLLALAYLIVMLLLFVMPHAVTKVELPEAILLPLVKIGGPVIFGAMALVPESSERETTREAIDLVYSVFLMLVLGVLSLGSVSLMLLKDVDYIQALLITLFGMAVMLLLSSWLWNPVAGFAGFGAVTSRYMLSIGLPFEQWIRSLAELAQREPEPERFLDSACKGMPTQLPWVSSCDWFDEKEKAGNPDSSRGEGGIRTLFRQGDLTLTLTTQQPLAPGLVWHFNLVAQLVTRFYAEKKRDRQLRELAYMQAVHETGARVTHDVKNLLQSLNALLFVIGEPNERASDKNAAQGEKAISGDAEKKSLQLLRRQLPLISQRLQQTLEKLRVPDAGENEMVTGAQWWRNLRLRYESHDLHFESVGDLSRLIPVGLFTNAAENLLQNAFDKRAGTPEITITVRLDMSGELAQLSVCDTGSPLTSAKAGDIGNRPVASENGLGIGLYQLTRLATLSNYTIELTANRPGEVCFSLRPAMAG